MPVSIPVDFRFFFAFGFGRTDGEDIDGDTDADWGGCMGEGAGGADTEEVLATLCREGVGIVIERAELDSWGLFKGGIFIVPDETGGGAVRGILGYVKIEGEDEEDTEGDCTTGEKLG